MNQEVVLLIVEDDPGHVALIRRNLKRAGLANQTVHLVDGQAALDFLFCEGDEPHREEGTAYLILLDIRMPKVDGVEVLRRVRADPFLRKIPIIMLTTTDDPREVGRCYDLGCSSYITKPVDYDSFVSAIRNLGLFLTVVKVPTVARED